MTDNKQTQIKAIAIQGALAPATAALMDKIIFHPLDTLITYQQYEQSNLLNTAMKLYQRYGLQGYYKGFTARLVLASMPAQAWVFGSYQSFKYLLGVNSCLNNMNNQLFSGLLTGISSAFFFCPLEAKRTRDTLDLSHHGRWHPYVSFRGFTPVLLKGLTHPTIAMVGTDVIRPYTQQYDQNGFVAGFVAGGLSQLVTTPLDVIKTKMMADYSQPQASFWKQLQSSYHKGEFMNSLGGRTIRYAGNTSLMIGTMSLIATHLGQRTQPREASQLPRPSSK